MVRGIREVGLDEDGEVAAEELGAGVQHGDEVVEGPRTLWSGGRKGGQELKLHS